jgi:hypothetical protein
MFSLFDIGLPGVTKKIGAAPRGLPLTLRNYIQQCARQHTVIFNIG